jgi:hypothetical protein
VLNPRGSIQSSEPLRSPGLLSDAVRQLSLASRDRPIKTSEPKRGQESANILRIMTNLLTYPSGRHRTPLHLSRHPSEPTPYHLLNNRLSNVVVRDLTNVLGVDKLLATEYVFATDDRIAGDCAHNARVAARHGYHGHERIFHILEAISHHRDEVVSPPFRFDGANRVVVLLYVLSYFLTYLLLKLFQVLSAGLNKRFTNAGHVFDGHLAASGTRVPSTLSYC